MASFMFAKSGFIISMNPIIMIVLKFICTWSNTVEIKIKLLQAKTKKENLQ
jgi:hypothetical protein